MGFGRNQTPRLLHNPLHSHTPFHFLGSGPYNARMITRTKIVATVGPASADINVMRKLVQAGCDVFRINFSHGSNEQRLGFLENIRRIERETGEPIAVMADLCGPKIRVGLIEGGCVRLVEGGKITIQRQPVTGTASRISTTLRELVDCLQVGQNVLLDDGKLRFVVESRKADEVECRVIRGGTLSDGKGVNLPQTELKLSALTEKDRADVEWIASQDFDFVALSFVRSPKDVQELRDLLSQHGGERLHIISKIEKPAALEQIEGIMAAGDGVMVARGDLGVEMDLPAVPAAQKKIAALARKMGKVCIIATQMLESMTQSPTPTRAEVSDVANAVMDCTDAVMLSGETAVGKFPVEAVGMMNRIVEAAQDYHDHCSCRQPVGPSAGNTVRAIVSAVREVLSVTNVAVTAVFTVSGQTALLLAKGRLPSPILAISPDKHAVRRMCMYYGVDAFLAPAPEHTRDVLEIAERCALSRGLAKTGDNIVVLSGRPINASGAINTLVVHQAGSTAAAAPELL